ncbi:MAG: alpha/beta hydrolase [Oscillospiraceae bacterium]|nr:alpha/beta hydrolase [Oscillospiraceae bacterium]
MRKGLLYIHGKGGAAAEAEHYRPLFPDCDVTGLEYGSRTPWEARDEFRRFAEHDHSIVVANSIGAFFAMHALGDTPIERAYFISPVVDMERLITDMLQWAGVTERDLMEQGTIETSFGETLSWEYLTWVRRHPVSWHVPTSILCGANDNLQSPDTIRAFAARTGADVTVMEGGEHWFHTAEQMAFLDNWIQRKRRLEAD